MATLMGPAATPTELGPTSGKDLSTSEETTIAATAEERTWRKKGLKERLRILESGANIPSFIDRATIDERTAWIKKQMAERQAKLAANRKGRTPGSA